MSLRGPDPGVWITKESKAFAARKQSVAASARRGNEEGGPCVRRSRRRKDGVQSNKYRGFERRMALGQTVDGPLDFQLVVLKSP